MRDTRDRVALSACRTLPVSALDDQQGLRLGDARYKDGERCGNNDPTQR